MNSSDTLRWNAELAGESKCQEDEINNNVLQTFVQVSPHKAVAECESMIAPMYIGPAQP